MPLARARAGLLTALTVATLALAACSAAPEPAVTEEALPSPNATSPAPTVTSEPTKDPEPVSVGVPTCEGIIPDSLIAEFEAEGWSFEEDSFRVGGLEIAEGVQCLWGDFTIASDHVQLFGWAPITSEESGIAQADLVAAGWRSETDDRGVIVTESADTTVATDDEGYGLTYLFGDGWVKYADTKQSLVLVEWPRS
ncbi:hypothetical protein RZO50_10915 [Microbacterium sp. SSW1-59]|uniref:hypothetical protein n=1 Tax=Microbacterium xanthum TaxID=3079794 RepID=UPI002AD1EDC6|nr:hypothetical protein [Microbacterium sp. SSW1-59]MDZ8202027.1 hypothetical protein [Microbacterium sp. SSW1-59]